MSSHKLCLLVQEGQPEDSDQTSGWLWWKAQKWVFHITPVVDLCQVKKWDLLVQEGQPEDSDARAGWPWWKAKKWVLHITHRLFTRYGDPKATRSGTDGDFVNMFSQQCSLKFLEAHMKLMASYAQV